MIVKDSAVLITGGARGIGRHLAERFLADGARVGVIDRDEASCTELRETSGGQIQAWACDLTDADAVDVTLRAIFDAGLVPDLLVNNAGIIHSEPLVNMLSRTERVHSREAWRRVMSADLDSVFYVTSRAVDLWLARRHKGTVVSISSISAHGNPGQSAYSAAKAGVNALTQTWAKELGPLGFRFAAIAPGFLDTPSTRAALSEAIITRLQQQIPLRRLGGVEHIYLSARHILENDYLNGLILDVDGGLVL